METTIVHKSRTINFWLAVTMSIPKNCCVKLEASWNGYRQQKKWTMPKRETDLKIVHLCLPGCFYSVESLLNTCVLKLRTKERYLVNLLNRSRGVLLGAFARRLINSLWPGAVGAVGEKHPTKMASPKTVWPTRKPKGFAIFSAPQPNSERMVKTLHGCGKLSRTGWRTGEEVPVGAGILIKSFMRGNSEELIRNLHFTF